MTSNGVFQVPIRHRVSNKEIDINDSEFDNPIKKHLAAMNNSHELVEFIGATKIREVAGEYYLAAGGLHSGTGDERIESLGEPSIARVRFENAVRKELSVAAPGIV